MQLIINRNRGLKIYSLLVYLIMDDTQLVVSKTNLNLTDLNLSTLNFFYKDQ